MPKTMNIHVAENGRGQVFAGGELFPYVTTGEPVVVKKHGYYEVTVTLLSDTVEYNAVPMQVTAEGELASPPDLFMSGVARV